MADQESILVHSITHEENEFDLSFLKSLTLVETLDLSGPRLMFKINDRFSIIRNKFRVKPGDLLKVTLNVEGDWYKTGLRDNLWFRILTMPVGHDDIIEFNCFQDDVARLKDPSCNAWLFPEQGPLPILEKYFPDAVRYDIDPFPITSGYHVLPGERPALMLRQMARELGAAIWYQRGIVCCKDLLKIADSTKNEPNHIFAYRDILAGEGQIVFYKAPHISAIAEDLLKRKYWGWSMIDGFMETTTEADDPPREFSSCSSLITVENLSKFLIPSILFQAAGNTEITAGLMLNVQWNLDQEDTPLDESLPESVLVGTVAHHYEAQKYYIQVNGLDLMPPHGPLGFE